MRKIIVLMGDFPEEIFHQFRVQVESLVDCYTSGANAKLFARGDANPAHLAAHMLYTHECLYGDLDR